jgi:hypothetical protein
MNGAWVTVMTFEEAFEHHMRFTWMVSEGLPSRLSRQKELFFRRTGMRSVDDKELPTLPTGQLSALFATSVWLWPSLRCSTVMGRAHSEHAAVAGAAGRLPSAWSAQYIFGVVYPWHSNSDGNYRDGSVQRRDGC